MLNSVAGILAASSWLSLSVITVMGVTVGAPASLTVNFAMAAVFGLVAVFLIWRTRAAARLRLAHPGDPVTVWFLRTQLVADLMMALLGTTFALAAGLRVWQQTMPVFG